MMRIYQVRLEDVRLFGYHGLFPEERVLGNWFILNLAISKQITQAFNDDIRIVQHLSPTCRASRYLETMLGGRSCVVWKENSEMNN